MAEKELLYKDLTYQIRGAVFEVHRALGPVHKESIYHNALKIEFDYLGIKYDTEKTIRIIYREKQVGIYKPDFIIEDKIIVEIKATPIITKAMLDQIYFYVRGSKYKLVLLANFGAKSAEIKRKIYD